MAKNNGTYYIRKAEKAGLEVKYGRGDHVKVYSPDHSSMMVIPSNLKGNGTEHSVMKWLVKYGVILTFICIVIAHNL
jgi:hypothetical protein